jgi:hypothetical protein
VDDLLGHINFPNALLEGDLIEKWMVVRVVPDIMTGCRYPAGAFCLVFQSAPFHKKGGFNTVAVKGSQQPICCRRVRRTIKG